DLLVPLLTHLALWSGTGLAAGLAFGIGSHMTPRSRLIGAALAGLAGAVLGTIVFDLGGAVLFPMVRTVDPFSLSAEARLMARLCLAGCVGLVAALSLPAPGAATKQA